MSTPPIPSLPQYRVTLFYGPDAVDGLDARVSCVFNVKKRSWKAGVQIAVELLLSQVRRLREALDFDAWLTMVTASLSEAEREAYRLRGEDVFVQEVCAVKLRLALAEDVRQENATVAGPRYIGELDRVVIRDAARIKSKILAELDLTTA